MSVQGDRRQTRRSESSKNPKGYKAKLAYLWNC